MLQVEGELLRMIGFAQLLAGLTHVLGLQVRNAADDAALMYCKKGHLFEEVLKFIL